MKLFRFALLASLLLAPAAAQDEMSSADAIALRNQILQLQAEVQALQAAQSNGQGSQSALPNPGGTAPQSAPNDLVAQLLTRVSNLEDQVRTLNGQIQELTNQVTQQNAQFTKQIGDINFQLQGGSASQPAAGGAGHPVTGQTGAPAAQAPGQASSGNNGPTSLTTGTLGTLPVGEVPAAGENAAVPPPAAPAGPSAQDRLQSGIEALGRRDYSAAEKDARAVLNTDRDSALGYDAQFLLARALAGRKQWDDAVLAYDETYKRARFGSHAQDARLGEARALYNLGDKGAACGALNLYAKQFPNPRPDLRETYSYLHNKACGS